MIRRALLIVLVSTLSIAALAQQSPSVARGFEPEKAYAMGEFDHVNIFNGNLIVTLPIGPKYPVNALSYNLNLIYNGNPWDFYGEYPSRTAVPSRFTNAGLGWQLSMGQLLGPTHPGVFASPGRWLYAGPDGAERLFYPKLHAEDTAEYVGDEVSPGDNTVVGFSRDSSYLRLKRLAPEQQPDTHWVSRYQIEFPDGTIHTFSSAPYVGPPEFDSEEGMSYRLTRIEDRFGNHVAVTYSESGDYAQWNISDSVGRAQTVYLQKHDFSTVGQRFLVKKVEMRAFSTDASEPANVTYEFEYSSYQNISTPCGSSVDSVANPTKAVFLERIAVTKDQQSLQTLFAMPEYDKIKPSGGCSHWAGHLTRLQLPTGGSIAYTPSKRVFPGERVAGGGVGGAGGDGPSGPSGVYSAAVGTRKLLDHDGNPLGTWQYVSQRMNLHSGPVGAAREMVVLVTDPTNRTTVHHFDVSRGASDSCYPNSSMWEYGLPFTRSAGTASGDFHLSTELFNGVCADWEPVTDGCQAVRGRCKKSDGSYLDTPEQRTWLRYASDTVTTYTNGKDGDQNWRVQASRVVQRDSGCSGCATDTVHTGFDGLGHYRTTAKSSGIPGTPTRTTTIGYNANLNKGEYVANSASNNPEHYMLKTGERWILGLHDTVKTTDAGADVAGVSTLIKELCFNRATGFLERTRTFAGATAAATDLVAVFAADAAGNVLSERYSGGDEPATAVPTWYNCTSQLPPAKYEIVHGYQHGVRSTSQYTGATFYVLDATIDQGTGLPRSTRDSAGAETTYVYDALQRLTTVKLPLGAEAHYTYNLSSTPASVTAQHKSDGAVITDARYYYDGFGRMMQARTRMPSLAWSVRKIAYDALGRKVSASAPEAATTAAYSDFTPIRTAAWQYDDPFGRTTNITQPDGAAVTFEYFGSREARRTSLVAAEGSTGLGAPFTVTEVFDGHGRLKSVTDAGAGTTAYSYDVADHLAKVCMGPTCEQTRLFTYDGRGLLTSEEHPEQNKVSYRYDAKGHILERLVSDAPELDQAFTYEVAERPFDISVRDVGTYVILKSFRYATANGVDQNGAIDWKKGRLETAVRNNRVPPLLHNMQVTETYGYDKNGRRRRKVTEIRDKNNNTVVRKLEQNQQYDSLGAPSVLTYPACIGLHCGAAPDGVLNTYSDGALTSVSGYASSIEYSPSGMPTKITHSNSVVDEIVEDSGMSRPKSITVKDGVACSAVSITTHPASIAIPRDTSTRLTVAAAGGSGFEYRWYQNGVAMRGEISAYLDTPRELTTQSYTVRVKNTCSSATSNAAVVTMVDPPAAPTGFRADRAAGSLAINLQWNAAAGAATYVVERRANGGSWATLLTGVTGTAAVDTNLVGDTAYLYRVRSVEANGVSSTAASNIDVAATLSFTPIASNTVVAAAHFGELLAVVNALRKIKGDPELPWSVLLPYDVPAPALGVRIHRTHVTVLRTALGAARAALELPALSFTDPDPGGTRPKVVHVTDIRRGVE